METPAAKKASEEVWETVQALNRAWAEEADAERLNEYFHRDMVAITPTARKRLEGRQACVAGWKAFVEAAEIRRWKMTEPDIRLYENGRFAVVTYYYEMTYEMGSRTVDAGGRDMFALVKEDGRWWAVADQFSPYP